MNTVKKIINLMIEDEEIAKKLFLFSEFKKDVSLWTEPPRDGNDYKNIKWLFVTKHANLSLVGVNTIDNTVWCIDDEGDFHQDCDALQDLPYEIIRIDCMATEEETVDGYFKKYEKYQLKKTLERYEKWCRDNGIKLDKSKIYHDENSNLFKKYFDKS